MLYQGQWRHPGNKHELKDIRKACEAEYDTLVAAALEHARKEAVHPLDLTSPGTVKTVLTAFRRREPPPSHYLFKTPIFTVENIETTAGIRSENQAIIPKMERILKKAGWMDELTIPDITKKCALNVNRGLMMMKPSILLDPLAQSLISTCAGVSVMMDATTVCHLLAPNWEARDYEFGMPIEVKTERIDGSEKKIVIVSKPMPSNTITRASIQRKTLKKTLKKQFVTKKAPAKAAPSADQPSTSSSENPKPSEESDSQESQESEAPSSDFLDDIISKMEKPKRKPKKEQLGDSMYQYAIFRIGDARLLVRSNAPYQFIQPGEKKYTLLQNARGITFEPRIEYLPTGGAMDLGAAEWVWNYTKAILKMSDSHILYRASYKLDHLLQVDALTMRPDLQEPPPDALGLLSSRCLMLERMIAQLENLEDGEYMAFQSKNVPLVVVSKCSDEDRGGVSIDAMRIKEDDIQMIPDQNSDDFFYGFAPEVPFQWQIVQGRAPRLLLAKDSPAATFVPSKNNRERVERQRHSIKRKFQEKKAEKEEAKRQKEIDWDDPNLYADFTNPSIAPMDFTRKQQKRKRGFGGGRGGGRGGKWEWRGGGGRGGRGRGGAGRGGDHHEEGGPSQEHTIPNIP
uniref:NARG2_C domain-containing protein n=1 Tax=Caenorhabditis tropicalis TaxID=1561998 RepID=A0A1I7U328_9PELO